MDGLQFHRIHPDQYEKFVLGGVTSDADVPHRNLVLHFLASLMKLTWVDIEYNLPLTTCIRLVFCLPPACLFLTGPSVQFPRHRVATKMTKHNLCLAVDMTHGSAAVQCIYVQD